MHCNALSCRARPASLRYNHNTRQVSAFGTPAASPARNLQRRYLQLSVCKAAFNFAPASDLDDTVHGCHMPGFADPFPSSVDLTGPAMKEWADFMKQQGVTTVVVLLGDDELGMFNPPLIDTYQSLGFSAHHLRARGPGNFAKITAVMEEVENNGGKVVVHCTGGCHRVGAVLTGWIATRHCLPGPEAAALMAATASKYSVNREAPAQDRLESYMSGAGW